MKVKVGYITRWRRAIFFTLVACIVVFGLVSTVCAKLIEAALVSNMVSVAALLLCIVVFVLVLSDKWARLHSVMINPSTLFPEMVQGRSESRLRIVGPSEAPGKKETMAFFSWYRQDS